MHLFARSAEGRSHGRNDYSMVERSNGRHSGPSSSSHHQPNDDMNNTPSPPPNWQPQSPYGDYGSNQYPNVAQPPKASRWRKLNRIQQVLVGCSGCAILLVLFGLVGAVVRPSNSQQPAAAKPTPGWHVVAVPPSLAPDYSELAALACSSSTECHAVGTYCPTTCSHRQEVLILDWRNNQWTLQAAHSIPKTYSSLFGVTCVDSANCWAVGAQGEAQGDASSTLVLRYAKKTWSAVASPNLPGASSSILQSIACASASNCWAVGSGCLQSCGSTAEIDASLIEHWNGASWSVMSVPPLTTSNQLWNVACPSVDDCWIVGSYRDSQNADQSMTLNWTGTRWNLVSTPIIGQWNDLDGLTCALSDDCTAVGFQDTTANGQIPLIERWDGTQWAVVDSPLSQKADSMTLDGVTCTSPASCWSVGSQFTKSWSVLSEQWDGKAWHVVGMPRLSNSGSSYDPNLGAVACPSTSACLAVGDIYFLNGHSNSKTHTTMLIEQWTK